MKITIASGKGGTGKTTFATNLAWTLAQAGQNIQLMDADVEEPNAHLFLNPDFEEMQPVHVKKPIWNEELCTDCGACAEACTYNALAVVNGKVLVFNELCHACGVCSHVCPTNALTEQPFEMGKVRIAPTSAGFFFADGLLNVGEPSAANVVKALNKMVNPDAVRIMDAAPGTGCPVVEAVEGADVDRHCCQPLGQRKRPDLGLCQGNRPSHPWKNPVQARICGDLFKRPNHCRGLPRTAGQPKIDLRKHPAAEGHRSPDRTGSGGHRCCRQAGAYL